MKYVPLVALVALGFAAAPAAAQTATDAQDSSGFTVGGVVGFDDITLKDQLADLDISEEDALYGAKLGYDVDLGSIFVGVEGEVTFSDVVLAGNNFVTVGDTVVIDANETYYIGARAGYEIGSRAAIYAKGGYSALQFDSTRFTPGDVSIDEQHVEGFTVGGGIQYDLSPSIRLNAEYRFSDLGEIEISGAPADYDAERSQITAGVSLRF